MAETLSVRLNEAAQWFRDYRQTGAQLTPDGVSNLVILLERAATDAVDLEEKALAGSGDKEKSRRRLAEIDNVVMFPSLYRQCDGAGGK